MSVSPRRIAYTALASVGLAGAMVVGGATAASAELVIRDNGQQCVAYWDNGDGSYTNWWNSDNSNQAR